MLFDLFLAVSDLGYRAGVSSYAVFGPFAWLIPVLGLILTLYLVAQGIRLVVHAYRGGFERRVLPVLALTTLAFAGCTRLEPLHEPTRYAPEDLAAEREEESKENRARIDLEGLASLVGIYYLRHDRVPASLDALLEGSEPLAERRHLKDPWGKPYLLLAGRRKPYRVVTTSPRGKVLSATVKGVPW